MKKLYFLIFILFLQSYIYCSAAVPFNIDFYAGYRADQFNWKIVSDTEEDILIYREKYEHPTYLQTGVSISILKDGLYFLSNFGCAPLLSKHMHITDTYLDNEYSYNYKINGIDFDGEIELGAAANLTPDRIYKFYVVPLVGYAGFWKSFKRYKPDPNPYLENNIDLFSCISSKKLRQVWYGPYVGGKFFIMPNQLISLDVSYHFNWMKLKIKTISSLDIYTRDIDGELLSHELIKKILDDSVNECYAHMAIAKLTFNTSKHLKIALSGKYNYYMADNEKMVFITDSKDIFPLEAQEKINSVCKIYSRWWNIVAALELIYQF